MITKTIMTLGIIAGFVIGISFSSVYAGIPWGTDDIADNAITTAKIKNKQVKTADIKNNAIKSGKIKDGEVKSEDLASGLSLTGGLTVTGDTSITSTLTVGSTSIDSANGNVNVGGAVNCTGCVDTTALATDSVNKEKITADGVGLSEIDVTITTWNAEKILAGGDIVNVPMIPVDGKSFCMLAKVDIKDLDVNGFCDIDYEGLSHWRLQANAKTAADHWICQAICIQFG